MAETWKAVPGFDGYEASDAGNVRSYMRNAETPQVLKQQVGTNGYYVVTLMRDKKRHSREVHSLVTLAFLGPRPEKLQTAHGNGNPLDNRLSNLRYDTAKGNAADRILHGTTIRGEAVWTAKLTEWSVDYLRKMWSTGAYKQKELAELFGVGQPEVSVIVNRKVWSHV